MAKIIKVDFSKRAKDIRELRKNRQSEKEETREQERINRAVEKNTGN